MIDLYTAVVLITILSLIITIADVVTSSLITKAAKVRSVITCLMIAISTLGECVGVLTNGAPAAMSFA